MRMSSVTSLTTGQILNGAKYVALIPLMIFWGGLSCRSIAQIVTCEKYSITQKIQGVAANALTGIACLIFVPGSAFLAARILAPAFLALKAWESAFHAADAVGFIVGILGLGITVFVAPHDMPHAANQMAHRTVRGHWISKRCLTSNLECTNVWRNENAH